ALIDVSVNVRLNEDVSVKVYPNPFEEMTTIEVSGKEYQELELLVFDALGRLVETINSKDENRIQLLRGRMRQGVYFYQLKGNNELISTGKIVVQ
ncbi:MAG: T9SS type A sorting domain-containing protein, partial [Aureispira sp.]|nr:T9SS type A sorting domain-containing protein [Aureispira sp.]